MAITDKEKGVWGLDQVYNKINQGSIWEYTSSSGFLWSWGKGDDWGNLGHNSRQTVSSPVQVGSDGTWVELGIDGRVYGSNFGIKNDGTLWAWGLNTVGQLGLNSPTNAARSSPTQIPGSTWSKLSHAYLRASAIKTDGTLWLWGYNNKGQLGHNNVTDYSSPVQVPGSTWKSITSGTTFSLATKTDGTLWGWGFNNYGMLGNNNLTSYSSPVQVPGTSWSYAWASEESVLSVRTDGTLWAWGRNTYGSLGQNNTTWRSSPTQIPGTYAVGQDKINGGYYGALAIKTDGTLWSWGYNGGGNLGQNNTTKYSSPTQIPGTTWNGVQSGYIYTAATKTDGTLWSWGLNSNGQLGQNNTTQYSSPIQIPGDWATNSGALGVGWDGMMAIKN